jgi:EAL domain-containing protein (putative c-di-GMP-specific phosphodiesterase class I)
METTLEDFEIQPIVDLASNRVCGGEVLWRPGGRGLCADLIRQIKEDPSLNIEVTRSAFLLAMQTFDRIESDVWLSINFPTYFIGNGDFFFKSVARAMPDLEQAKRQAGKRLVFELSEDDLIRQEGLHLVERLGADHAIAIDDFGSGHAPLLNMVKLNFDKIKIDRSIVSGCDADGKKQRFIKWLVNGCHAIGASVCAEGIETESELAFLKRCQVGEGQGFLWSPSVSTEKFVSMAAPVKSNLQSLGQVIELNK